MKREAKRRYAITARPFNSDEKQILQGILAKRAKQGRFDPTGLIRALEWAIIEYGRKNTPTVTVSQVRKELLAIAKHSEALSRQLHGLSRTTWFVLETEGVAQPLLDAYRESRSDDWERTDIEVHGFPDHFQADALLLKHLTARTATAAQKSARSFGGRGRPIDIENPAHGLVIRIRHVLGKYGIPTRPNRRTTFEAVLRVAFSAAGLGAIADPLAIAKRIAELIE